MLLSLILMAGVTLIYTSCGAPTPTTATTAVTATATSTPSWKTLGTAGFYPQAAAISGYMSMQVYNNTPYVAFQDQNTGYGVVMDYNGSSWVTVGNAPFSSVYVSCICLAIYNGTPYVSFEDSSSTPAYKLSVKSFNGVSWSYVGSAGFTSSTQISTGQLYIASNGTPYVVYQDPSLSYKATVMTYTASTWSVVGAADFTPGYAGLPEFFFDGTQPSVAYLDGTHGTQLSAMTFNGTWGQLGSAGFSASAGAGQVASNTALIGSNPAVCFGVDPTGFMVYTLNGTSWSELGGADVNTGGGAAYTSLAVNGTTPYVAYQDYANGYKASVMSYNGGSWANLGPAGFSSGSVTFTQMGFINGNPCVAFADAANSGKPTVMIYK